MKEHESELTDLMAPLREPLFREVIKYLGVRPGERGLDAGCGNGGLTLLWAEAVGSKGRVTGLDADADLLNIAEHRARKAGLADRVDFHLGEVERMPFGDQLFDWVLSVDCVGYPSWRPPESVKEIRRVTKPGGWAALAAWSSQRLLMGRPMLEANLNATEAGIAPFEEGRPPERHFLHALGWLQAAGFTRTEARTFTVDLRAPLTEAQKDALTALFQMRWEASRTEVSPKDWLIYQKLCQPGSPDFILDRDDYYGFFTYTVFVGVNGD